MKKRLFLAFAMLMTVCSFCWAGNEAYAVYTEGNGTYSNPNTLTFYYDDQFNNRPGKVFRDFIGSLNGPEWIYGDYPIEKAVFDESFAAARPTSTGGWFSNITTLTRIEGLQYLNTSAVTSMGWMFNGCSSLSFLDLGSFDTRNVSVMTYMFYGCSSLTRIIAGDNWSTQNVTESEYMFGACTSLVGGEGTVYDVNNTDKAYARIDGGPDSETPGYLSTRPSGYAVYTSSNQTFTFYNDGKMDEKTGDNMYLLPIDGEVPEWFSNNNKKKVTTVVFDNSFATAYPINTSDWFNHFEKLITIEGIENLNTDKVTSMSAMFNYCSKLQSLDLSTFNTSNVTNMTMMFGFCEQLEELDIRNFDTSNVTYMAMMFDGCKQLTELDLRSFDTHNVTSMVMMFSGCSNLRTIYANDAKWNTDKVDDYGYSMFSGCTNLVGGNGTSYDPSKTNITYARIDGGPDNPGYLTSKLGAYALYDNRADIKTLTFYYDDQRDRRIGTKKYDLNDDNITPGWITDNCYIEKVVFDESFKDAHPTRTYQWFKNCTALEFITGIENLNTSDVTDMSSMFYLCSNLGSLDLSHFNTSNVRNMWGMFCGCENLETLTLGSGFNTQNVTVMSNLFNNCKKLTSISLSSFDTGEVEYMDGMFSGCSGLTSLSLSGFNTAKVTNMDSMFDSCSGLTSLNLSSFDTGNVTDMYGMFQYCENLKTITVGQDWSTQNVTSSSKMFFCCDELKGGAGTPFDPDIIDKEYAHVDGLGGPGYLTAVSYGITIDGKAVTFANKYDVLGNETVYYDDALNILTLDNANVSSISIASSAPKNLRILVWGECKVAHTATKGNAFTTSIASTTIEGQGNAKLTISSKNGVGINIKRSSSAGLLVKDIDLVVKGNTAGIIGTANATSTRFYSSLAFENTNCIISRGGGEQGSVGIINKMVLEKCHWTTGEFDKTNHYVLANPMVIERDVIGITTGIENGQRNSVKGQRDEWYTIDGQKLSGKPTQKGI